MNNQKSIIGSVLAGIITIVGINYKESILSIMGIFELLMILIAIVVIGFIWIYNRINTVGKELKDKIILLRDIYEKKIYDIDQVVDNNWQSGHVRLETTLSQLLKKKVELKEGPIEKNPELQAARKMQQNLRDDIKKLEVKFNEWESI